MDSSISRLGPVFTDSNGAVDAAKARLGVALVRRSFVASLIEEGLLIVPFEQGMKSALAYYLVYPAVSLEQPHIAPFHRWLTAIARQ
ncbi:hypothetical protein JMY81_03010 [Brenneria goodwinii]|uniref:LysR substrate-binding domain-containing protein n=1 Tax=Brenneria goodwinii TaxID=1109412 RepID=UPI000EF248DF|nr:LysR substrate-binding domain-containing protein [Brenneria goodwinii]MCG8154855.1 hypothetical protein [Brenneria goodwinii]MCG8159808.1 hypothetical protein [Brenneria goodwinii]MCG8164093.1 hypothetical protein [Brenneria goodwinii]MCG8168702.1 hypothetical protein [Brenneria goodwinii]MCG8173743.1 hypothetical protein [Brenneria goodwinii]